MCGPLSVAITGCWLLNKYINLHEFWLLNPPVDPGKVSRRCFWWYSIPNQSLSSISGFSLEDRRLVVSYASGTGSFEHMLTVSRDSEGRAYSVTSTRRARDISVNCYMTRPGRRAVCCLDGPQVTHWHDWLRWISINVFAPVPEPTPQQTDLAARSTRSWLMRWGWKILIKRWRAPGPARRDRDRLHAARSSTAHVSWSPHAGGAAGNRAGWLSWHGACKHRWALV
jgi:hypothetical protein